jgi:hypothetical protein
MLKESIGNRSVYSRYYAHRKSLVDLEDVGGKVSFKADCPRGYFVEYRGNPLKGLVRYLASRVGANWDLVFSDLRRQLRKEAAHDLVTALEHEVMTHTYLAADGTVMARRGVDADVPVASTYYRFYVHPVSRCLQPVEVKSYRSEVRARKAEQSRAAATSRKELPDGSLALNLKGVWYKVELAPVPAIPGRCEEYWYFDQRDAVLNRYLRHLSPWELTQVYGVSKVYAVGKKQMTSKDIAKFGLSH